MDHPGASRLFRRRFWPLTVGWLLAWLLVPPALAGITLEESNDPVTIGDTLVYTIFADDVPGALLGIELTLPPGVSVDSDSVSQSDPDSSLREVLPNLFEWEILGSSSFQTLTIPLFIGPSVNPGDQVNILVDWVNSDPDSPVILTESTDIVGFEGPQPDLTLTDIPDPVLAGSGTGNLIYTVRAIDIATFGSDLLVTVSRPAGVVLDSVSSSEANGQIIGDPQQGSFNWVPATNDETLTLVFTVDATASPADQVSVSVVEQTERTDPAPVQGDETTDIDAPTSSILTLDIVDEPDPVVVGDTLEYLLVIGNEGPAFVSPVEYQFTFPPEVSYISGGIGSCLPVTNILNCVITEGLQPDETRTIPILVSVDSLPLSADEPDSIFAFAELPGTGISDSEPTRVLADSISGADISISKQGPSTASVGDVFDYTLVVKNNDASLTIVDILVTDYLPAGVDLLSSPDDCSLSGGFDITKVDPIFTCLIGILPPESQQTLEFTVQVEVCEDSLLNQAEVSYVAEVQNPQAADPNPGNNSTSTLTTCQVLPPENLADLRIIKSDSSDPVSAGGLLGYELLVINQGPNRARNVLVRDRLPAGVSAVDLPAECVDNGFQIDCRLDQLAPGAQYRFDLSVEVAEDARGQLSNSVAVSSDSRDPNFDNNQDFEYTSITPPAPSADLLVEKTVPASVGVGARFDYRISVMNAGTASAEAVVLSDDLPTSLTLVTGQPSQGSCGSDAGTLSCQLGTLATGASATVALTVDLDPAVRGEILNTATVSSITPDPNSDNNRAMARTVVALNRQELPVGAVCSRYRAVLTGPGVGEPLTPAPPGLVFSREADSLILTGVPEVAGEYTLLVRFEEADGNAQPVFFDLLVTDGGLAITPPSAVPGQRLPPPVLGGDYGVQLQAQGGNPPYRWQSPAPPAGLTLYDSGLLAGSPLQTGDYLLPVQVIDARGETTGTELRLQVQAPGLGDRTPPLPAGLVGLDYRAPALLSATPAPLLCSVATGALPPGLRLDDDCRIRGIPTTAGRYPFSVAAVSPGLPPIIGNRVLTIAADTPIPRGLPPRLTPLPAVSVPVPPQCRPPIPPDEFIQQGTVDPFGNIYLVGSIRIQDQYDLLLRKYDPRGALVWEQRFDSGGDDRGYAVTVTPTLEIVAAGLLNDGERYRGLVIGHAFSGARRWVRQFGDSAVTALYDVAADSQGLYLAGERYNGLNFDALLLALDHDGEIRWEVLRDSRDTETAYRVVPLPCAAPDPTACQLLVGGFRDEGRAQGWLERRNRNGELQDDAVLQELPVESLIASGDGVVVGGATDGGWRIQGLDGGFDRLWSARLEAGQALRAMARDLEGNLYVAGQMNGGNGDGFLWLLSPAGDPLDQVLFDEGEDEKLTAVVIGPDGRLMVAGQRLGGLGNRILLLEVDNGKGFADEDR